MRALTPTPQLQRASPRSATHVADSGPPDSLTIFTPSSVHLQTAEASSPLSVPTSPLLDTNGAYAMTDLVRVTPDNSQDICTLTEAGLLEENKKLKLQIEKLTEQLKHVLDHSVESDTRLLQYTDRVFVTNSCRAEESREMHTRESAVQCNLQTTCQDERCTETRALVTSLKTSIEVLEAELKWMRAERKREAEGTYHGELTIVKKQGLLPIQTNNRFDALKGLHETAEVKNSAPVKKPKVASKRSKVKTRSVSDYKRSNNKTDKSDSVKEELVFPSVQIEGDSHGRHIASLVQNLVSSKTRVLGICKPGAKLQNVTTDSSPPPGGCTIIVAGTNDVSAGEQGNIYRYLEKRVTNYLRTAMVIVATLPHRHDLPAEHPVNQQTALVNSYIQQMCARHRGAVLLDINKIGRRFFTRHGMHLRMLGKRLLARLIVENLKKATSAPTTEQFTPLCSSSSTTACTSSPTNAASSEQSALSIASIERPPDASELLTLPYATFADAVKTQQCEDRDNRSTAKNDQLLMTVTGD